MILEAHLTTTGTLINKPDVHILRLTNLDTVAVRRKDEETNDIVQLTIQDLYNAYKKRSSYDEKPKNIEVKETLFEDWFSEKYIKGTPFETRIIDLRFVER